MFYHDSLPSSYLTCASMRVSIQRPASNFMTSSRHSSSASTDLKLGSSPVGTMHLSRYNQHRINSCDLLIYCHETVLQFLRQILSGKTTVVGIKHSLLPAWRCIHTKSKCFELSVSQCRKLFSSCIQDL